MSDLPEKDFKIAILNMITELKEIMIKEVKGQKLLRSLTAIAPPQLTS